MSNKKFHIEENIHGQGLVTEGGHHGEGEKVEDSHHHSLEGVWFGLVALGGIYLFFIMERLIAIFNQCRRKKGVKSVRVKSVSTVYCSGYFYVCVIINYLFCCLSMCTCVPVLF